MPQSNYVKNSSKGSTFLKIILDTYNQNKDGNADVTGNNASEIEWIKHFKVLL